MKSSWTAVSFIALTALAGASIAFAGCTVTSGKVDNIEGGTSSGSSGTSGTSGSSGTDGAVVNACPGNTKETISPIVSKACQDLLDSNCCAELTTCFNIDPTTTDAGAGALDCNKFSQCVDKCNGGPPADKNQCQKECDLATPDSVQTAYDAIAACISSHPPVLTACQK